MILSPGVRQGKDRVDHGLGRADGHDHIRFRVKRASHEAPSLTRQRLPEVRRAHRDGVLVRAKCADLGQTVGERLGGSKSGKPCARLIAPHARLTRVMRRMTESVNNLFFLLISCIVYSCLS